MAIGHRTILAEVPLNLNMGVLTLILHTLLDDHVLTRR